MTDKKRYVTLRDIDTDQHYIIDCKNPYNALKQAGEIHRLGVHKYVQVRLRSTKPSLKKYKLISNILELVKIS